MIRVADATHLFNPDWETLLQDVQTLELDRVDRGNGDWGGWGVMTKTGDYREDFGGGHHFINDDGTASAAYPYHLDGKHDLVWTEAATPTVRRTIEQVRRLGLFPSRARITTLIASGKNKWHVDGEGDDPLYRLHFVLKSNPKALLEARDRTYHLAPRRAYIFNTNFHHRITNAGDEVRIHLLMDLNMPKQVEKLCEGRWL